jgi:thiamine-monophosphate kinase
VPEDRVLKRFGCAAGDSLYVSGPVGAGNALGLIRLAGLPDKLFPEELYRPASRLAQGRLLRECASCCMDSSDGLLATLDQLMRINDTGLSIECPWEELVAPPALRLCQSTGTPAWSMAAGPHGEFELVAAVPPAKEAAFRSAVQVQGMSFTRIGTVKKEAGLLFRLRSGEQVPVDAAPFRNLLFAVGTDMRRYLREFLAIGAAMKLDR